MQILLTVLTTKRESLITKPYSNIRILNFEELMGRLNTGYLLHLFLQRIYENLNHSVFWKISRLKTLSCSNLYYVVLRDSLEFKFKSYYFFFFILYIMSIFYLTCQSGIKHVEKIIQHERHKKSRYFAQFRVNKVFQVFVLFKNILNNNYGNKHTVRSEQVKKYIGFYNSV